MARSCYSMVLDQPAHQVWAAIRQFDHYGWAGVPGETVIEEGRRGDQVGAVRRVVTGERTLRQQLLAHSDIARSYTYSVCEPSPLPVRNYVATIRVLPVVETGQSFVEWWADFDCAPGEVERWTGFYAREGFAKWLAALRDYMRARPAPVG